MPKFEKNLLLQEILKAELRVFKLEELKRLPWVQKSNPASLNKMLRSLVQDAWLLAIKKGVYALSSIVSGSPIHEFEIAMKVVSPAMISHYSAFRHHGLTDQLPRDLFITTIKETATPQAGKQGKKASFIFNGVTYQFIQIKQEFFFGQEKAWVGTGSFIVTDLERTLLDGLARPQFCGGLSEVLNAYQEHIAEIELTKIIGYALKLGVAVSRRLGWVLDHLEVGSDQIQDLAQRDHRGYRKLDPTKPAIGNYDPKWRLQLNNHEGKRS
jgi:predicted transcriptional regulator of viral defense system